MLFHLNESNILDDDVKKNVNGIKKYNIDYVTVFLNSKTLV